MKLKHCPCCGDKQPVLMSDPSAFVTYRPVIKTIGYKIRCGECGLQTCWWHDEKNAVMFWNRRTNNKEDK